MTDNDTPEDRRKETLRKFKNWMITEVEKRLDLEVHEDLCACSGGPGECATYGEKIPWTHSDVGRVFEVSAEVLAEQIVLEVRMYPEDRKDVLEWMRAMGDHDGRG